MTRLLRELVAETAVSPARLIQPHFVLPGTKKAEEIESMPGIRRESVDRLVETVGKDLELGISKVLLFGIPEEKDPEARGAYAKGAVVPTAVRELKKAFGEDLLVAVDVCLCAYFDHGHCGVLEDGEIRNDETLPLLEKMAITCAEAGADLIAPSDMMDGRVMAIREALDDDGFETTPILSYAAKFASAYYGPFREAAHSAPAAGDRKSYQADYRNAKAALQDALLDEDEGADILMVKPALPYLDIIHALRGATYLPVAAYNVSGEYSMVKLAAEKGLAAERDLVLENLTAIRRAGADIIITYHARDALRGKWL
jgi:porphobilinogen synthase